MTIAIASRPSSSGYWSPIRSQSPSHSHAQATPVSKRKRTSCVFDNDAGSTSAGWPQSMMASPSPSHSQRGAAVDADVAATKRSRTLAPTSPHLLSTSPSNVPFSSAFRAPTTSRPPTVDEQQSWSSSSSQPSSSPPAGAYASPSSTWTKVTTDYGHAWEPSAGSTGKAKEESGMGMAVDDEEEEKEAIKRWKTGEWLTGSSTINTTTSSSSTASPLWTHIEGDSDMMYDPDTGRRGDSIAWDSDILQLRVPTNTHAHPYSPSATSASNSRAQLGATYFDQAVWQANQDRMMQ